MANLDIFLKRDIKTMIDIPSQSVGFIRGYMTACYHYSQITLETYLELKEYLKDNLDNVIKRKES